MTWTTTPMSQAYKRAPRPIDSSLPIAVAERRADIEIVDAVFVHRLAKDGDVVWSAPRASATAPEGRNEARRMLSAGPGTRK